MINHFIKRKSRDNEGNKDYKNLNLNSQAFGLFRHGHVQNIEVATSENGDVIHTKYKLNVTMINSGEQAGEITYACYSQVLVL